MRLPDPSHRTVVLGSTGSGKTRFACFLLSTRDFHVRPWVIFDFKGDDLIAQIPAREIRITDAPPSRPGLYVVRPLPDDHDLVETFLYKCWEQENIGLYIDEGYMIGKNGRSRWFRALLTQGRSKQIPLITLSQRPLWIDRFVLSEADFFAVFRLNDYRDMNTLSGLCNAPVNERLPAFHSYWYDVGRDETSVFRPVPSDRDILKRFAAKTGQRLRVT